MATLAPTVDIKDTKLAEQQGAGTAQVPIGPVGGQFPPASPDSNFDHTQIKSNFVQSPSKFWALKLPLLSARYIFEAINAIFKPKRKFEAEEKSKNLGEERQFMGIEWALGVGLSSMGVTSFYTKRTYGDMKRQFAESLGWEFNKPPEQVGFVDMWKSKNDIVHDAIRNFVKRTALRFSVDLPFFAFVLPTPFKEHGKPIVLGKIKYSQFLSAKDSVNFGVGTNAIYLATDALGRKKTFFEEEQQIIESKINHTYATGELVTAQDLINLYDRQVHSKSSAAPFPKMSTPEWQADVKLFERMADLMNQTYSNAPKVEHADFTVPKFIYLVGMGLISASNAESSRAYVEVASRYGIPAVKKVGGAVKNGATLSAALADYPVNLAPVNEQPVVTASIPVEQVPAKTFTSEALKKTRSEAPPASHVDKAMQQSETQDGIMR